MMPMSLPIRQSTRAKRMFLQVHPGGDWEVVVPARHPPSLRVIKSFVRKHRSWLERHVARMRNVHKPKSLSHRGTSRRKVEARTRQLVEATIVEMRHVHPVTVERIRFGNFKSQWGSCSLGMTLGFHYKLCLLPTHLARYIIAHELAHTTHFNHSRVFWNLVNRLHPNVSACKKELRAYSPM